MSGSFVPRHRSTISNFSTSVPIKEDQDAASNRLMILSDSGSQEESTSAEHSEDDAQSKEQDDETEEDNDPLSNTASPELQQATRRKSRSRKTVSTTWRLRWLQYTKNERDIYRQVEQLEARDLTHHLLNVHGLRARQSARKRERENAPPAVDSKATATAARLSRRRDIDEFVPRVTWTRWPMHPSSVPRPQPRVWYGSITKPEVRTSRTELQDQLFAFLLKTAHTQWKARDPLSSTTLASQQSQPPLATTSNIPATQPDFQKPVFSADDERSCRLLNPGVQSTISTLDTVLTALHTARAATTPNYLADPATTRGFHNRIDWSEVLGTAAITGIPAAAIARAATRCAAALGEGMAFHLLREEDAVRDVVPAHAFTPQNIHDTTSEHASTRLYDAPDKVAEWTLANGCPYKSCTWYGRRFAPHIKEEEVVEIEGSRGGGSGSGSQAQSVPHTRLMEHMQRKHLWIHGIPADLEVAVGGMAGGVHVDGFMQPIGYRGPGKGARNKRRKVDASTSESVAADTVAGADVSVDHDDDQAADGEA